ncbi:lytic transglycosylase domain-containing protein [Actinomadura sp. NPDC048032]|uniref:lytic transglycosylase domain-containing protein n=1 Tax=Actinomadura sp. NPDC048032 TaxID=3155747 RepID=UPI0034053F88
MVTFSLGKLIFRTGCFGSMAIAALLVAAMFVAVQNMLAPGATFACGPANPDGPDLLSPAPKPSRTGGPTVAPVVYRRAQAGGSLDAGAVRNVAAAAKAPTDSIPANYVQLYKAAGPKYGIPWYLIAGIGKVETDHGRSKLPGVSSGENYAGAGGPMQFLQSTFNAYAVDGNNDGKKSRYDPADAIFSAANYLHASGAPGDTRKAIFAYNHSTDYVNLVLSWAERYAGGKFSLGGQNNAGASCASFGDGGNWKPGSVCPAGGGMVEGNITKRTACVRDQIKTLFGVPRGIGCYRANGGIPGGGEHPLGRACDFMISSGAPNAREVQLGYDIANWAKANAGRLGIMYIIYRQHIWNPDRAGEGWRQMEDRGGLTANHYDHVHISVLGDVRAA